MLYPFNFQKPSNTPYVRIGILEKAIRNFMKFRMFFLRARGGCALTNWQTRSRIHADSVHYRVHLNVTQEARFHSAAVEAAAKNSPLKMLFRRTGSCLVEQW
jgi:hypothetical protein